MRRSSLAGAVTPIVFACVLGMALLLCQTLVAGDDENASSEAEAIQPAKAAATKEEALKLAKDEDLPAIAKADKVVIKQFFNDEEHFDEPKEVTVEDKATLKKIHKALTIEHVEPTLGEMKYELHFYLGDVLIRKVWVFPYGEWYIVRPGTDWALGLNEALADLLDQLSAGYDENEAADDKVIQPAKADNTQEAAIKRAKAEDLPAIAKADKVVIKQFFTDDDFLDEAREITVEGEETLNKVRKALTVKQVEPSGGETQYELHFHLGDVLIREIWVYPYGEWGITRGKGPDWALGLNEALADLLDEISEEAD